MESVRDRRAGHPGDEETAFDLRADGPDAATAGAAPSVGAQRVRPHGSGWLAVVRHRYLRPFAWVFLAAVLGALAGATYGYVKPPAYEVKGEMEVSASFDLTGEDQVDAEVQPQDVVTQQALIDSQAVAQTAKAAVGSGYGTCAASTSTDSSVIQVVADAATGEEATATLDGCLKAYLALVASQQSTLIKLRLDVYNQRAQAAAGQLQQLDAVVAATPSTQQATVVGQQAAERAAAVAERSDDQNRVARLQSALSSLPVNISRLAAPGVQPEPTGLVLWQWSAAAALLSAGAVGLVLLRVSERRRR